MSPAALISAWGEVKATVGWGLDIVPFGGEFWGSMGDGVEMSRVSGELASPQPITRATKRMWATKNRTRTGKQGMRLLVPLEIIFANVTKEV